MKKNWFVFPIIIVFVGLLFINQTKIVSHSPSSLTLEYVTETEQLNILIIHSVGDRETHYVYLIEIWKNDVSISNDSYTSQTTTSVLSFEFTLSANAGDTIKVKASCNQGGSLTETIVVQSISPTSAVPAYPVCITIAGLSILTFISIFKRKR